MRNYLPILKNVPLFEGMTEEELLSVFHCVEAKVIKKTEGEFVLRAGESTAYMGLVLSGSVLIIQEDLWGHRNVMSKAQTGDFFAEVFAASLQTPANCSVVANEECEILMLNANRLLTVCPSACEHHSRLIRNFVQVLANKMLQINDKITHMSKRTTREKLLSYLSAQSIRQGSLSFDIPFDRQQLADYLCVERAAMSVELSRLQKDGILKTRKNHFTIAAPMSEE